MARQNDKITVIGTDISEGNALIHFSDGTSVLFMAHFLDEVRDHDGNVPLSNELEEE